MLDYFSSHPNSYSKIRQIQSSGAWVTSLEQAGKQPCRMIRCSKNVAWIGLKSFEQYGQGWCSTFWQQSGRKRCIVIQVSKYLMDHLCPILAIRCKSQRLTQCVSFAWISCTRLCTVLQNGASDAPVTYWLIKTRYFTLRIENPRVGGSVLLLATIFIMTVRSHNPH